MQVEMLEVEKQQVTGEAGAGEQTEVLWLGHGLGYSRSDTVLLRVLCPSLWRGDIGQRSNDEGLCWAEIW